MVGSKSLNISAFSATNIVFPFSITVDGLGIQERRTELSREHAEIRNILVLPAQAGIQRLKSLDYRIHPCITNYVL